MSAFAVKHILEDQGPLIANLKEIRRTPYSFTSKEPEATAATGNNIYVIEVRCVGGNRTYWLGYKYQAREKFKLTGGRKWKERFDSKNSATPGTIAVGAYFDSLPEITDPALLEWLRSGTFGMTEIPSGQIAALDAIIANPMNCAKKFA